MINYEYKVHLVQEGRYGEDGAEDTERVLNRFGSEGWKLVKITTYDNDPDSRIRNSYFIFEREKQ